MDELGRIRKTLAEYLAERLAGDNIRVMEQYPANWRQVPPESAGVAVGFAGVAFPGSPDGINQAKLTLRFDILCPVSAPNDCHKVFEKLCGALICVRGQFGVGGISCGEITYERGLPAFALTANAMLSGLFTPPEDAQGVPLESILVKTKGVSI